MLQARLFSRHGGSVKGYFAPFLDIDSDGVPAMARILSILVIEDENLLGETIAAILAERGHEVAFASDGDDGRRQCGQVEFDLVITDLLVPAAGRTGTILKLGDASGRPRVLATSGLQRPFSAHELLDAVDRAVA